MMFKLSNNDNNNNNDNNKHFNQKMNSFKKERQT